MTAYALASIVLHAVILQWAGGAVGAGAQGRQGSDEAPVLRATLIARPLPLAAEVAAATGSGESGGKAARSAPSGSPDPSPGLLALASPPALVQITAEPEPKPLPAPEPEPEPEPAPNPTSQPRPDPEPAPPPRPEPTPQPPPPPQPAVEPSPAQAPEPASGPVTEPSLLRHVFRVYLGEHFEGMLVARLQYSVWHDGRRYEVRTRGSAQGLSALFYRGLMQQESRGRLGPGGIEPLHYEERRGDRTPRQLVFDPDAGVFRSGADASTEQALPPGTQDRLSVFYQIGLAVRADPARFVPGASISLPVATFNRVDTERFEVVGEALVHTDGRALRALHLVRQRNPARGFQRLDLWLGYDLNLLPVRLRIEESGNRVLDQVIELDG